MMFQQAAKTEYDRLIAEAAQMTNDKRFNDAIKTLETYPEEYGRTEWPEKLAAKKVEVEADKAAYEKEQERLRKAKEAANQLISKSEGLAAKNEFDKALAALRSYPAEYNDTDSQALVKNQIAKVEKSQKEYQKAQTTMGIVIAVVIVVLLIIVIAISAAGKKGKKPEAPVAEAPAYEEPVEEAAPAEEPAEVPQEEQAEEGDIQADDAADDTPQETPPGQ